MLNNVTYTDSSRRPDRRAAGRGLSDVRSFHARPTPQSLLSRYCSWQGASSTYYQNFQALYIIVIAT